MLTYRLEQRVGKVDVIGVARLAGYVFRNNKVSTDDSTKANACFTGNLNDAIFGVLFRINPKSIRLLDKAEGYGKGYDKKNIKVELVETGESAEALIYYGTKLDDTGMNLPYDWYMAITKAGAEEHKLPPGYIQFINSLPTKEDLNPNRRDVHLMILRHRLLPWKILLPSFELIAFYQQQTMFNIELPGHILDGRQLQLTYTGHDFLFNGQSPIPYGVQTHQELNVKGKELQLNSPGNKILIEGEHFVLKSISYDEDTHLKILQGEITSFRTSEFQKDAQLYHRLIIPRKGAGASELHNYQTGGFNIAFKVRSGLLELTLNNITYNFYPYSQDNASYLVIDSMHAVTINEFQRAAHAILISFAFLSRVDLAENGWFFSYEDHSHNMPLAVLFHKMGSISETSFPVFTTNRFIGIEVEAVERDVNGAVDAGEMYRLYPEMHFFSRAVFEKFCQNALSQEKILRSLVLLGNNSQVTLEMKIPIQFVVLEALSATMVTGGNGELKPLNDKLGAQLISQLNAQIEVFVKENGLKMDQLKAITGKISNLNSPPNADKLSKVFGPVGYMLTDEEFKIIKDRNIFLHGSMPKLTGAIEDHQELFHRSLRLHFLIAVLLLKNAGFEGRIINYSQLYRLVTGKFIEEPVLKTI